MRQEKAAFEKAAEEIREAVRGDPALAELAKQLAIDMTPEGLRIQIMDEVKQPMFATGSAVPNDRARDLLRKVAPFLQKLPKAISIAGYTDATPYAGPGKTNWELSSERANATRRLLTDGGLAGDPHPHRDRPRRPRSAVAGRSAGRGEPAHRDRGAARTRTGAAARGPGTLIAAIAMLTIGGLVFLAHLRLRQLPGIRRQRGAAWSRRCRSRLWTIGGAAAGAFVMANSMHDVKHTMGGFGKILKGAVYKKPDYVELLSLMYFLVRLASTKGNMALEPHIEKPDESSAFQRFPKIIANHHACRPDLRLSAAGRHERRRSQSDRRRHGAGTEEDAERGTASGACVADHGGRSAGTWASSPPFWA